MRNDFNPWPVIVQGQAAEQGMAQAGLEGMSLRERLAFKKAGAAIGSQNYFASYEGVPGAERPGYLKEAWANADPAQALQLEQLMAEPFKMNRAAEQAGKIEAAKKASDLEYNKNMIKELFPLGMQEVMGQGVNAFGAQMQAPGSGVLAPGQPMAGTPSGLSPVERTMDMTPQGLKFGMKQISPFEQSLKLGEDEARRKGTTLAETKETREAKAQAFQKVKDLQQQILKVREMAQQNLLAPAEVNQALPALTQEHEAARAELDGLMRGVATPQTGGQVPASQMPTAMPSRGLSYKDTQEVVKKGIEQKNTAANKEIDQARVGVEKVTKFLPQIKEMHQLVTTQDIGHPALDSIYGAGNVLSLNRANAQVKKLNEAIINMFAEPGQSQMMNTIVERQMQGAVVPGLFTEPQLNKINSSILLSNVEHLRNLPTFLEHWQEKHGGTLTGAADAWIDYTDHNRRYAYTKDARGNVRVTEQKKVLTPDVWQSLRDTGKVRDMKDGRTFVQQSDRSWKEQ